VVSIQLTTHPLPVSGEIYYLLFTIYYLLFTIYQMDFFC